MVLHVQYSKYIIFFLSLGMWRMEFSTSLVCQSWKSPWRYLNQLLALAHVLWKAEPEARVQNWDFLGRYKLRMVRVKKKLGSETKENVWVFTHVTTIQLLNEVPKKHSRSLGRQAFLAHKTPWKVCEEKPHFIEVQGGGKWRTCVCQFPSYSQGAPHGEQTPLHFQGMSSIPGGHSGKHIPYSVLRHFI